MSRIDFVLLAALIGSSLMLVKTAYESRTLFAALDRARAEAQSLESDHQRLQAAREKQATGLRVEKVARERLRMRGANATVTEFVVDADAPSASAASGATP